MGARIRKLVTEIPIAIAIILKIIFSVTVHSVNSEQGMIFLVVAVDDAVGDLRLSPDSSFFKYIY